MGWGWDASPPIQEGARSWQCPPKQSRCPAVPPGLQRRRRGGCAPLCGATCKRHFLQQTIPPPPPHPGTPAACGVTPPSPLGFWGGHPNHEPDPPPKKCAPLQLRGLGGCW